MPSERALALQAELQQLKAAHRQLKIHKAPAGAPGAPFPITLAAVIPAPPGCRVDVEHLSLRVTITQELLTQPPPAGALQIAADGEPPLPAPLAAEVARRLRAAWAAAAGGGFGLGALLGAAEAQFSQLVGCMPEFLEAYEGVDEAGATARRFALISPAAAIAITAAAPPAPAVAAPAAHPAAAAAAAARALAGAAAARAPAARGARPPVVPPARRAPAGAGGGGGEPAGGWESEVQWLTTKFGSALRLEQRHEEADAAQHTDGGGPSASQLPAAACGGAPPARFSLMLRPTDPDWGAQRGAIHLTGEWEPHAAPGGAWRLRVRPTMGVPPPLAAALEAAAAREAAAGGGAALRRALRWLEGYAGGVQPAAAAAAAAGAGEGAGPRSSGERGGGGGSSGGGSEESSYDYSDEGEGDVTSDDSDDSSGGSSGGGGGEEGGGRAGAGGAAGPPAAGAGPEQQHGGGAAFGLALEGLQLDKIDALEIINAHLQLSCDRCGTAAAAELSATPAAAAGAHAGGGGRAGAPRSWEWRGACGKCAAGMWAMARPKIVHEASNEIAAIKTEGCRPLDLLPSLFGAQCGDCSASVALRSVQIGVPSTRNCTHCHGQLTLVIPAVAFIPKRAPGAAERAAREGRRAAGERRGGGCGGGGGGDGRAAVVPGAPLPFLGTCKHYRHSHRWLRFPCCGKRFACDICHEEGTDGHEMAWAKRMTCGYCSAEQAVADACAACGKRLASTAANPSGRLTRFWEGGQGCRDPNQMSKKDPRRYRNSKAKTKSAKSKRVGPKPGS